MDNVKRLVFFFSFLLSSNCWSTTVDLSNQSNFAKSSSGLMWATKASGAPTGQLITGNRASVPFQYNVPSDKSLVPVSGVRESNISTGRIGKAVTNFAKKVGPVAVGLAVADLVCDLSDICDDGFGLWEKQAEYDSDLYPTSVPPGYYWVASPSNSGPTPGAACAAYSSAISSTNPDLTASLEGDNCRVNIATGQTGSLQHIFQETSGCPTNYSSSNGQCNLQGSNETAPPSDQNWADSEAALNDDRFIQPLFDAGAELPVDQPDPFPPVNTITGSTTKTIKDADGNIIGTEVTEKTLTVSDVSSPDSPNLVDVTEEKKVTTYDADNNVTNTETSVSNPPPIQPPTEEKDFEIDDVTDEDLQEHEISDTFDYESWGSGSCPADKDITHAYGSMTLSMQPACDFATASKPIVIALSAIVAMFLISGIRTE